MPGAWAVWFEGDNVPVDITEIHGDELEALRSAYRQTPDAGSVMHFKPRVTFVPYGMGIDAAELAGSTPFVDDDEVTS